MDVERGYVCSSSNSLSSSTTADAAAMLEEEDRMVKIEMEVAEALADLAHLPMRECSGRKWGSKGKRQRVKKRVKSESPSVDSVPTARPDLTSDRALMDQQHGEPICKNVLVNPAKAELDTDLHKQSPSVRSYPSNSGSRSRQNLTEAEKEERRLRRILANRESARQTIRRRQALCEELTRKAADLAWENENLKRKKELTLKEYQSLEATNRHLKAKMAKVIKAEVEESPRDLKSAHVEMPTTPAANCPWFLYSQHSFSTLCWPSMIQSSNPVQSHHGPQNAILHPSNIPMQANGKPDSSQDEYENPINGNGPRTPLYIMPCPWFLPVTDHGNGAHLQPPFGLKHMQDGTSVNSQCSGSPSPEAGGREENQRSFLPVKVKSEATSLPEARIINDLNETPMGFPPDGGGQCEGSHPKEVIFTTVPLSSVTRTIAIRNETGPQSECAPSTDTICTKSSQLISVLPGKNQDLFKFPTKKPVDAVAAAEARRRRKELTRLKNLHGRQCRMNC